MLNGADMTNDEKLQLEMYNARRDELFKRKLSKSENFDKAILTVSTAALGFSLAFINQIVHIDAAKYMEILYISWLLLALTIIFTLASFLIGQNEIKEELKRVKRYYLDKDQSAFDESMSKSHWAEVCNYFAVTLFAAGVFLTSIFAFLNLHK